MVEGLSTPYVYVGRAGTVFPGHLEHNLLCSFNFNIGPGSKTWITIPYREVQRLEGLLHARELCLAGRNVVFSEDFLRENDIAYEVLHQRPGVYNAYSSIYCMGLTCICIGYAVFVVNAVHYGLNDNCVAVAWNLLPRLAQAVDQVRIEELRIRAHNRAHAVKYLGAINLACITVQALLNSTDPADLRACVAHALEWAKSYVDSMGNYDSAKWEILEANMHVCPTCEMQAYPALNESSKCHYCWTKCPRNIVCSLSLEGMRGY